MEKKVLERIALLAPVFILHFAIPFIFETHPDGEAPIRNVLNLYIIIIAILVLNSILNFFHEIYLTFPMSREIPMTGFVQVLKIALYFGGAPPK